MKSSAAINIWLYMLDGVPLDEIFNNEDIAGYNCNIMWRSPCESYVKLEYSKGGSVMGVCPKCGGYLFEILGSMGVQCETCSYIIKEDGTDDTSEMDPQTLKELNE